MEERQVIRSLEAVAMEALQEVEEAMAAQVEEGMEVPQVETEVAMEGQQVDFQAEDMEELPLPVLAEDLVAKCRCSNAAPCRSKSARMSRDNNARQ